MKSARSFAAIGIIRKSELDFYDDGTHFSYYEYRGLPITYAKKDGEMFFSIRPDYIKHFASEDYVVKPWYKRCYEFNGVEEIDKYELITALDEVVAGVRELEKEIESMTLDFSDFDKRKQTEIEIIDNIIEKVRTEFNWFYASEYTLANVKRYIDILSQYKHNLKKMEHENTPQMRSKLNNLKTKGYIFITDNDYFVKRLLLYIKDSSSDCKF